MGKKLIIAMAILSFALAGTTFAAVENIKVSGDVSATGVVRSLGLGNGETIDTDGAYHEAFLSQIRLKFDADLTEGVSATLRLISQETWGEDNADDIEVDLASVELKEFLYDPLTLIIGKQNLRYGSGLIVGDPDTNQGATNDAATGLPGVATDLSLRKSFDAVRAVLDFAPWTIDLVMAQIDEGSTNQQFDDEKMYGINAAYDWSSYNGVTEFYMFKGDKTPLSTTSVDVKKDNVTVVGMRAAFDPTDKISVSGELGYQFGDNDTAANDGSVRAYALQAGGEYKFLNDYNAKVGANYTYLSGNKENDEDYNNAWVPMWEDQTPGEIINILMNNSNASIISISGSMMPREDLTLGLSYALAHQAQEVAGSAGNPNNVSYSPATGPASNNTYRTIAGKTHFGDEWDMFALYDYTEDVQIKLTSAIFMPGSIFSEDNDGLAYSVKAGINVGF